MHVWKTVRIIASAAAGCTIAASVMAAVPAAATALPKTAQAAVIVVVHGTAEAVAQCPTGDTVTGGGGAASTGITVSTPAVNLSSWTVEGDPTGDESVTASAICAA